MPKNKIRLVSWNVNGIRAVFKKEFAQSVKSLNTDVLALQETKLQEHQRTDDMMQLNDYTHSHWSYSSVKKGYSGVVTYSKTKPSSVKHGIGISGYDNEGRILEMDFESFVFFNIYFPNGQMNEDRLQYKMSFYRDFFEYTDALINNGRSVIVSGDFNTAHNEIDLKHPKPNSKRSGFLREERDVLDDLISRGYVDTFRYLYPDKVEYSWWSYRFNARKNNAGWRIDYFFVSPDLIKNKSVKDAFICQDIFGSDHCPVGIDLVI